MSVLESFLILFETNSDDVKKGTQDAKGAVDGLQNSLNRTDVVTKKVGEGFLDMSRHAVGLLSAFIGVGAIVNRVFATSEFTAMLNDASETLGIASENIAAWGGAVKENGGSTESFVGTLKNLSAAMTQVDVTGKSRLKPFFDSLHISLLDAQGNTRPVLDLLLDLSTAFESMSKQDSAAIGRRMGLDEGTILLLQKGRREVEATLKVYKDLGEITKKDTEASDAFHDQIDRLGYAFTVMFAKVGTAVLPAFTGLLKMLEGLYKWVSEHGTTVQTFVAGLALLLLTRLVPALWATVAAMIPFGARGLQLVGLTGVLGTMAGKVWALLAPVLAVGAAFLVWEDFFNYLKGNDSVFKRIEEWLEKLSGFKWLGDVVSNFREGVNPNAPSINRPYVPSAQTRADFLRATGVKNSNVNIGEVNIQTQATDAKGIATDMTGALSHTLNGYDDGVER